MFPTDIGDLARQVITAYTARKIRLVTAESCTGGLIAGALTDVPGASAVVERGFVSYSNEAKAEMLGVEPEVLEQFGTVSARVAEDMARGALNFSRADKALSVTGIAGPDGGSAGKPVGLVFFGVATREGVVIHYQCHFTGSREAVRIEAVQEALRLLLSLVD